MPVAMLPPAIRFPVPKRSRPAVLAACILMALSLSGCLGGATDAEVAQLQDSMSSAFHKRGQKVTKFLLSKDSRYQVSGMIYVDIESATGTRSFYTTCLATMNESTRKWDWHCDGLP